MAGKFGFKPHIINWDIVSTGKRNGGLALGGILKGSVALLGKWLWRFPKEQNSLWAAVIRSKFGRGKDGWHSTQILHSTHSS